MMENGELTPEEKAAFENLSNHRMPPAQLENRVLDVLKKEGLIKENTITMNTYLKWAASIAASVILFFAGSYWGKSNVNAVEINPKMGYMMILHEDENFKPGDPMAMFEEYGAWMQNIAERGIVITGQELSNEATIIQDDRTLKLGEEVIERTSGYFIIEAKNQQEALEVARQNPHVKYGGKIELKAFLVR